MDNIDDQIVGSVEEKYWKKNKDIRNSLRRGKSLLYSALLDYDDQMASSMLHLMHDDEVKDVILGDKLVKCYAALRVDSLRSTDEQQINDMHRVSQGPRTLARLVLETRKKKPLATMANLIHLQNF